MARWLVNHLELPPLGSLHRYPSHNRLMEGADLYTRCVCVCGLHQLLDATSTSKNARAHPNFSAIPVTSDEWSRREQLTQMLPHRPICCQMAVPCYRRSRKQATIRARSHFATAGPAFASERNITTKLGVSHGIKLGSQPLNFKHCNH